jgi:hypothetical protein
MLSNYLKHVLDFIGQLVPGIGENKILNNRQTEIKTQVNKTIGYAL